jgi:hypothetical protein
MAVGEGGMELEGAAVGIAVQVGNRTRHRLLRGGERAERPFVRRELDHTLEPELALDVLDGLARLIRREPGDRRAKEISAYLGPTLHGRDPTVARPRQGRCNRGRAGGARCSRPPPHCEPRRDCVPCL